MTIDKVVNAISCLDPDILINKKQIAKERMTTLLEILCNQNLISLELAENCSVQFNQFLNENGVVKEHFNN
ncbi:hypothetical protein NQ314_011136 [Rhamnusium bicolor]|uniref:Uncharacterized protein n=1 Tax=Rhamnusium bicolor TaxID=1586634 RepID=A0AAV8XK49_9CUCU|nr:hypothetical protein NQ314_011136 [Rhamnusium bicolor]